jgi:hypothetical protein
VVAKARGFAEQVRRTARHAAAPASASHPHANWQCTVYRATGAAGVAQTQTQTQTPDPSPTLRPDPSPGARTRARARPRWWRCRRA